VRGVEAPFQLLISVFTMILVVAIAFHVLNTVSSQRCDQMWDQSVSSLANAISRAAMSEPPTTDVVTLQLRCGDAVAHEFYVMEQEKSQCAQICGEYAAQCYVLVHQAFDRKNEVISTNLHCLRGFSPYLYSLLKGGTQGCPQGYVPFFNGTIIAANQTAAASAAVIGTVSPSPVSLPVYIFRDEDGIRVCKKQ